MRLGSSEKLFGFSIGGPTNELLRPFTKRGGKTGLGYKKLARLPWLMVYIKLHFSSNGVDIKEVKSVILR